MTAAQLLESLQARGVSISANGDALSLDAPKGALTEGDRAQLKEMKPQIIALLRPQVGAASRPRIVQSRHLLTGCPYCDGEVESKSDLYHCPGCQTYFRRVEPETEFAPSGC
jgi:hypothetical protein